MRDAVVNCRPTKMQKNSAREQRAREQAAARACRRARTGDAASTGPEPDQDRRAGRAQRRLPERRHLGQRRLRGDLVQAPEKAAERRGRRRRARRGWRALRLARSPSLERGGLLGVPFAPPSHGQAHRRFDQQQPSSAGDEPAGVGERRGRRCPSRRDGAAPGPTAPRSATLIASAPSSSSTPIARRRGRAVHDQVQRDARDAGVQHARQAAVVEQVRSRRAGRAASAARRAARRRDRMPARAPTRPSAPTSSAPAEVGARRCSAL